MNESIQRRRLLRSGYDLDETESILADVADDERDRRRDDQMIEELEKEPTPC